MNSENQKETLLIVDDDLRLQQLLTKYLGEQGYATSAVGSGDAMDRWLEQHHSDLIILDLMLPGEDGLSLARRLRSSSNIPIIILSARGEELDRIIGLEVGADDYLAKPFNPRELLARIRAVLRRGNAAASQTNHEQGSVDTQADMAKQSLFRFGNFSLDLNAQILLKDDKEVELTSGEMALLIALVEHPNRVLSREQLMDMINAGEHEPFDRSIDVRITRLRHKIEDSTSKPRFIRTVWGEGYRFTPDTTSESSR
ncbi:MAG: response regulator [Proteobacteria bacterium]|nr:response regulator [Pseudomonadota bacterium]